MKCRETYVYLGLLAFAFLLGGLLIHQRAEVLRLRSELFAASASVATFGNANEHLAGKLEDCETTRAAIHKTANACGEGWTICEKRWGEMGWR